MSDYQRVERAIQYLADNLTEQPTLAQLAKHLNLSPFHLQRLFCRWAGVSPKRFLQVLTLERAKTLLRESRSVLEVADRLGLSSASRLYDHFVEIESVTPGSFKVRGEGLQVEFGSHTTPFGSMFVAFTKRGLCRAAFLECQEDAFPLQQLQRDWPQAELRENSQAARQLLEQMFQMSATHHPTLPLHVRGTRFQIAVWKALLNIPPGMATSYSRIAEHIGRPGSARAVGQAVGLNPVAVVVPCHRVIAQSGALGGYHWGVGRKQALQIWEAARGQPR